MKYQPRRKGTTVETRLAPRFFNHQTGARCVRTTAMPDHLLYRASVRDFMCCVMCHTILEILTYIQMISTVDKKKRTGENV